ncbi:MAG TPA: membrane protein insertion efficiency factor YidD [Mariniflexile sp.]
MKRLLLISIKIYNKVLSPILSGLFGHACRYRPTCSEYALLAIDKYGSLKGLLLATKRILRCNPLVGSDIYDPVR